MLLPGRICPGPSWKSSVPSNPLHFHPTTFSPPNLPGLWFTDALLRRWFMNALLRKCFSFRFCFHGFKKSRGHGEGRAGRSDVAVRLLLEINPKKRMIFVELLFPGLLVNTLPRRSRVGLEGAIHEANLKENDRKIYSIHRISNGSRTLCTVHFLFFSETF